MATFEFREDTFSARRLSVRPSKREQLFHIAYVVLSRRDVRSGGPHEGAPAAADVPRGAAVAAATRKAHVVVVLLLLVRAAAARPLGFAASRDRSLLCGIIERLLGLWASPSGDGRIAPHPDTTSLGPS